MKKFLTATVLALLLLSTVSGCKTFRKMFNRTPSSMKRRSHEEMQQQKVKRKHVKGSTGDPLFDSIYRNKHQQRHTFSNDTVFNSKERELINRSFSNSGSSNDNDAIRRINDKNRRSRNKRRDEVFGTKDGRYF